MSSLRKNTEKNNANSEDKNERIVGKNSPKEKPRKKKEKKQKKTADKSKFKYLTGLLFAKMVRGGASELRANADQVNKLNVFPVPDGDTGDNMSMTIESGIAALSGAKTNSLAEVIRILSHGMLLGARGNSGVILSQFFLGIAKGFENSYKANPETLGTALKLGVEKAYLSVMTPTEGTILTVMREAVDYAVSRIDKNSTIKSLFSDLAGEMNASLARTPQLLPALKEAGVVDSGGAGLYYIIDGLNRVLSGEKLPETNTLEFQREAKNNVTPSLISETDLSFGYCTEFVLQLKEEYACKDNFDIERLKELLSEIGDSVVAFVAESIVKVHVHTKAPEAVLALGHKYGEFISVKIENMSLQHSERLSKNDSGASSKKKYATVAVSFGDGIEEIFKQLGADAIITAGQSGTSSTSDFINAFRSVSAEYIFVFPNNANIIMTAMQAAEIYKEAKVYVIATGSIGAGYVALSSFESDAESPEEIVATLSKDISSITTAYVSPCARDADMDGISIKCGEIIGVIEKKIVACAKSLSEATERLIENLTEDYNLSTLTVFYGASLVGPDINRLKLFVESRYPNVELNLFYGGQGIYPFIFIAE